jgi:hypothetical protein
VAKEERLCLVCWNCLNFDSAVGRSSCASREMLGFGTATAAVVVVSDAPLLVLSSCFNKAFWCSTVVAGVVVTAAAEALFSSSLVTSGAALEGEVNT